jgi:prepilin-type N-terminal cleavage/methylation domain-containing protein
MLTHSVDATAPETAHRRRSDGFTLVEVVVALLLLSVAVLGMGTTASRMATTAAAAEWAALALESVEDRIVEIRMDPRYTALDSIYAGTESDVLGSGSSRVTTVTHETGGSPAVDFKTIAVTVTVPQFDTKVSRKIVVAAP